MSTAEATMQFAAVQTLPERRSRLSWQRLAQYGGPLALVGAVLAGCGDTNSRADDPNQPGNTNSYNPAVTAHTTGATQPGPAVLLKGSHHAEIQQFGANTFADYEHAAEMGPALQIGATVDVDCLATGPVAAALTAKGKWYHVEAPAQYAGYYIAANTFENGDTTGPLSSQPAVDPAVPDCPK